MMGVKGVSIAHILKRMHSTRTGKMEAAMPRPDAAAVRKAKDIRRRLAELAEDQYINQQNAA